ncbi:DUF952 domain-containing protein [Streptomyces sp. ME01-24h]|nr:DUF952 domain-containing protein [Streptomyces sp. ME19-03-3]MDX3356754.1 DUF952 domain-containing protein [Streptomyces sp. ME01-24h]
MPTCEGTSGGYAMSARGRTLEQERFVHVPTGGRLPRVAASGYGDHRAPTTSWCRSWAGPGLGVRLRYEAMPPDRAEFPHAYGPLPVEAVVAVEPWG